jgi:hypothetical protein
MNFWKSLLTDKSFWAAIIALATSILVALNVPQGSIAQITTLISAAGVVVAYVISDGIKQAAAIKAQAQIEMTKASIEAKR